MLILISAAKSAPSFVVEIVNKRVVEGESAKFECQFSGTPIPGINYPPPPKVKCPSHNVEMSNVSYIYYT